MKTFSIFSLILISLGSCKTEVSKEELIMLHEYNANRIERQNERIEEISSKVNRNERHFKEDSTIWAQTVSYLKGPISVENAKEIINTLLDSMVVENWDVEVKIREVAKSTLYFVELVEENPTPKNKVLCKLAITQLKESIIDYYVMMHSLDLHSAWLGAQWQYFVEIEEDIVKLVFLKINNSSYYSGEFKYMTISDRQGKVDYELEIIGNVYIYRFPKGPSNRYLVQFEREAIIKGKPWPFGYEDFKMVLDLEKHRFFNQKRYYELDWDVDFSEWNKE